MYLTRETGATASTVLSTHDRSSTSTRKRRRRDDRCTARDGRRGAGPVRVHPRERTRRPPDVADALRQSADGVCRLHRLRARRRLPRGLCARGAAANVRQHAHVDHAHGPPVERLRGGGAHHHQELPPLRQARPAALCRRGRDGVRHPARRHARARRAERGGARRGARAADVGAAARPRRVRTSTTPTSSRGASPSPTSWSSPRTSARAAPTWPSSRRCSWARRPRGGRWWSARSRRRPTSPASSRASTTSPPSSTATARSPSGTTRPRRRTAWSWR